jgi:hypothetical protein
MLICQRVDAEVVTIDLADDFEESADLSIIMLHHV